MRFAGALLLLSSLAACRPAPAPSAPRVAHPRPTAAAELFPDDLDLVVRVDAARIRQNPMLAGVVRELAKNGSSEMLASVKTAFVEATAVWLGTRWMSDGFHGDGVLAIEGAPGADSRVSASTDAAGVGDGAKEGTRRQLAVPWPDVEAFERPAASRGEAALEIVLQGRGVVLATAAEADAVLRVLRSGPAQERLDPPARGLISFAGRPRGGAPLGAMTKSGMLAEMAEGLIGYAGSIEEGDAIEVEAFLAYASANEASRAAQRAKVVAERVAAAGGTVGTMANSVKLTEVGASLRVRIAVPFAWLGELH